MHTQFIESLIKTGYEGSFQPTFKDGRFSLTNKQTMFAKMIDTQFTVNSELSADFNVCGRKPAIRSYVGEADYAGINKKFFDDSGVYSPLAAVNDFALKAPGVRMTRTDIEAFAQSQVYEDTQEAYLYNMLVSWFKAILYQDTGSKDGVLKVKQKGYSDSHVRAEFGGVTDEITHEIKMGPPVAEMPEVTMTQRSKENYWSKPLVFRFDNRSSEQYSFYLTHCFGRDGRSALNVDVPIQSVNFDALLFEPAAGAMRSITNPDLLPWTDAATMFGWIKDYVALNRLEHAFAAAFEMLSAIAFSPSPSYQESLVWNKCIQYVSMAPFTPCRAKIPTNLEGDAMVYDMDAHDFMICETNSPRKLMFSGALINYLAFMGLHGVLSNYAARHSDHVSAYYHSHAELEVTTALTARASLASVVTGKDVTTFMNNNMFLTYDVSPMATVKQISFEEVFDPDYPKAVTIQGIPPYVSGCLFMGCNASDIQALSHLSGDVHVETDAYGTVSPEEAVKAAQIYRFFGHELEIRDSRTEELHELFAPVRECIIYPTRIYHNTRDTDRLQLMSALRRPGRSSVIPDVSLLSAKVAIDLSVTRPHLSMTFFAKRTLPIAPAMVLPQRNRDLHFRVNGKVTLHSVTMRASRTPAKLPGFQTDTIDPAPLLPVVKAGPVPMALNTEEGEETAAVNVE